MIPSSKDTTSASLRIASVIGFYFTVSISLVFLNKLLLSYGKYEFPFPITVTLYQLIIAVVCSYLMAGLGRKVDALSFIPPFEIKRDILEKVAPLSVIFVLQLIFSNLCLQYVEVSFYQVARSLTIIFNILFSYVFLGEKTSKNSMLACSIVVLGYVVGAAYEAKFTWIGLIFGILSSAFVSINGIYIKRTLAVVDGNQWTATNYNNVLSVPMILPALLVSGELQGALSVPFLFDGGFWFLMTVTAVLGYLINIAIFLQIKHTSPLTNNISGTTKSCVQTFISVAVFHNPVTKLGMIGSLICILGGFVYSLVRHYEMRMRQSAKV